MSALTYIHSSEDAPNTLSEIGRVNSLVAPSDYMGLYAYATQSGFASFNLKMSAAFWEETPTRWLFGFDYGRTQPQAIRSILAKASAQVRIFDGAWIVDQHGFLPRRDFHAKVSFMLNPGHARFGMVVGSGNFSSNGLRASIEAGAALYTVDEGAFAASIEPSLSVANVLWDSATPAQDVLDAYEQRWISSFGRGSGDDAASAIEQEISATSIFWIEAGYVTKNRGADRPGNQIDFPRGMARYFGLSSPENLPVNSVIGEITFQPPIGGAVTRNLRLGNNHMEKISLPTPEEHGFDIYDGKVLVFERTNGAFKMNALEVADFESAFGDRLSGVRTMVSGRRYGRIV